MNIQQFSKSTGLFEASELEKVILLAFYHYKVGGENSFTIKDVCIWFAHLHFANPNISRLAKRLASSKTKEITKGKTGGAFKLSAKVIHSLESKYPELDDDSEEIESVDSILPKAVYENTRGYIIKLAQQINASYENNLFDAAAVLMRRLVEVLLVLSYREHSLIHCIQDANGEYKNLNLIIADACSNKALGLSKPTKACLDIFRKLGNFSAHLIEYNAKKPDIRNVALDYRAAIEELLYKSGVLK